MKLLYTAFLSLIISVTALAQGNGKISGTVVDSLSRKPVEFANVAVLNAQGTPVNGAVCDDKGKFTVTRIPEGQYVLKVTFIGFETTTLKVTVDGRNEDLGTIVIAPTPQVLKEVVVEGQKAIIEERVDRTVYNAENDATAKGGDATDVLKRVPMLSVDMDGNVSLRGNQNILVLINNKPSTIMASSIADALKQIPADQIKSVEVITSPSAKYDAEGSAGIINIITKKNTLEGLTLNVDAGVGLRGSNLGLNGNYRRGKMGFSLGGFGRANYNIIGSFKNSQTTGEVTNIQRADTRNNGLFGNYNFGWDYDINEKNSLAASVRFGVRNNNSYQDDLTTERFESDILTQSTLANVESVNENNNIDASLTYTHYYAKPQRELSFQGNFSRNNGLNNFQRFTYDPNTTTDLLNRFKNLNDSYNQEITAQVDYQTPIGTSQMLEFGAKNISRRVFSDFQTFAADGTDPYQPSLGTSGNNNLNYDQNVTAAYSSYTYSTKNGYSFKAGLRYEYTTITAFTETEDNIEIPSYDILVPSINASRRLKNGNTVKLSYNRRIQRPSIRFLNPNQQWQNDLNVTIGNPSLDPEFTNNFEVGYSTLLKGLVLNMTGFARLTNDAIQSIRTSALIDGRTVNLTTYENIGVENAYGTSIFANINIGKLSLNGGGDVYYAVLDNNNPDESLRQKNEGFVYSGRLFGGYNLEKGWALQLFSFYRGRQVQLQGYQGGFYMYSIAVRKEFNEKRGSIGLGVENFLQSAMVIRTEIDAPTIQQESVNRMVNSSIRLNFSYRIGKMSTEPRQRRRRSINNDDLKEGDGGGDMGGGGNNNAGGPGMNTGGFGGNRPGGNIQRPNTNTNKQDTTKASSDTVVYDAAGNWNYSIPDMPQGGAGVFSITKENGVFSGTVKSERIKEPQKLNNLVVKGNNVSFNYDVNFGGNTVNIGVSYIVKGDSFEGTMSIGTFRTVNISGTKAK